jgi:hypothetical protein
MIMESALVDLLDFMALWVFSLLDPTDLDVHAQVEVDIARFLGVEAAIIYAQAFSTISSVIPDFSKRGDIIVAYDFI